MEYLGFLKPPTCHWCFKTKLPTPIYPPPPTKLQYVSPYNKQPVQINYTMIPWVDSLFAANYYNATSLHSDYAIYPSHHSITITCTMFAFGQSLYLYVVWRSMTCCPPVNLHSHLLTQLEYNYVYAGRCRVVIRAIFKHKRTISNKTLLLTLYISEYLRRRSLWIHKTQTYSMISGRVESMNYHI